MAARGGMMIFNKSLSRLFALLTIMVFALAGIFTPTVLGQDPTGRPKTPRTRPKPPPKKPPAKPEPTEITVILTVLTDPPECTVYINGNARGLTNSEGKTVFEKVPVGHYSVEVRKEGFLPMVRGFNAGTDSPTLVFKLEADLEIVVQEFNSLLDAGKLAGPDSPNALQVLNATAEKFPGRPEIARMRGALLPRLEEPIVPTIERTIFNWKTVTNDAIAQALGGATNALILNGDDNRLQAKAAYLRGALALRDSMTSPSQQKLGEEPGDSLSIARSEFEKSLSFDQFYAPARYQLGIVQLRSGDFAGAEESFRIMTQLEPRWVFVHTNLGRAYYGQGKYKEAMEANRKALEMDSNYGAAYAGLGVARVMSREKNGEKNGIKEIERAKQLDPSSGLPHLYLGIIYSQSKKSKEQKQAVEELKIAMEKNLLNLEFQNTIAEQLIADLQKPKKK